MRMRYYFLLLCFPLTQALAQQVSNIRAESRGDLVYVFYDLQGSMKGEKYKVALYSSHNNGQEPVALTSGNVGDTITAGVGKRIEWQAMNELSYYKGEISFEVEATLVYSPLVMASVQAGKVYKRAKAHTFTWRGGVADEKIRIELYKGNTRVMQTEDVPNKKKYTVRIPSDAKPGDGYRLKVTTLNHPGNYTLTPAFKVRRRYGWPLKLVPAVAAGGVYLLIEKPWEEDRRLPEPPGLPPKAQ